MWRKRTRPEVDLPPVPDDITEAQKLRAQATAQLKAVQRQAPMVQRMTDVLIDRQGKNHYIELLYQHVPKGAS